jgi:hypothetical protein
MTINYSVTYEILDEESASYGDVKEHGFDDENAECDFRDMVDLLRGTEPSSSESDSRNWYTQYGEMDYQTGEYENKSYHPKTARDSRYMLKAWEAGNKA